MEEAALGPDAAAVAARAIASHLSRSDVVVESWSEVTAGTALVLVLWRRDLVGISQCGVENVIRDLRRCGGRVLAGMTLADFKYVQKSVVKGNARYRQCQSES